MFDPLTPPPLTSPLPPLHPFRRPPDTAPEPIAVSRILHGDSHDLLSHEERVPLRGITARRRSNYELDSLSSMNDELFLVPQGAPPPSPPPTPPAEEDVGMQDASASSTSDDVEDMPSEGMSDTGPVSGAASPVLYPAFSTPALVPPHLVEPGAPTRANGASSFDNSPFPMSSLNPASAGSVSAASLSDDVEDLEYTPTRAPSRATSLRATSPAPGAPRRDRHGAEVCTMAGLRWADLKDLRFANSEEAHDLAAAGATWASSLWLLHFRTDSGMACVTTVERLRNRGVFEQDSAIVEMGSELGDDPSLDDAVLEAVGQQPLTLLSELALARDDQRSLEAFPQALALWSLHRHHARQGSSDGTASDVCIPSAVRNSQRSQCSVGSRDEPTSSVPFDGAGGALNPPNSIFNMAALFGMSLADELDGAFLPDAAPPRAGTPGSMMIADGFDLEAPADLPSDILYSDSGDEPPGPATALDDIDAAASQGSNGFALPLEVSLLSHSISDALFGTPADGSASNDFSVFQPTGVHSGSSVSSELGSINEMDDETLEAATRDWYPPPPSPPASNIPPNAAISAIWFIQRVARGYISRQATSLMIEHHFEEIEAHLDMELLERALPMVFAIFYGMGWQLQPQFQ